MFKQVLINVEATDMRVAVLEDGMLVELFVEDFAQQTLLGNIYKGKVEGVVPGLKAVFVNIGQERNAFLHFSDVLQEYDLPSRGRPERLAPSSNRSQEKSADKNGGDSGEEDDYIDPQVLPGEGEDGEPGVERPARRSRPLRVGDSILVQVTKEPISEKGPRVTSYVSIPGRYLVMMPFSEHQGGVSRKIEDMEERRRLRDLLRGLEGDSGSFIVRTAGLEEEESAIREDHDALVKQWNLIKKKHLKANAPALIHNEQDIIQRLVRDTLRNDINEILIDSKQEMKGLVKAIDSMAPAMRDRVHLFESSKNIFDVFEVEQQFQKALRRKVWLKSGGFVVIDETEALTAIDVNSGKYVGSEDQHQVILKTNLEACRVVSRQLRLRDIGGLIVVDFIDMTNRDHQAQVLREFRSCLKRDNAKYAMTGLSEFGLVEMTRKRVRRSLVHSVYQLCPYCEGAGKILGKAQIWKRIKYDLIDQLNKDETMEAAEIAVHSSIRTYLESEVLDDIKIIARRHNVRLNFVGRQDYHLEQYTITKQAISTVQEEEKPEGRRRRVPAKKGLESALTPHDNPQ